MGRKRTTTQVKEEERQIKLEENTSDTSEEEDAATPQKLKKHKIDYEKEYTELSARYDKLKKRSYILLENSAKLENVHKDAQKALKEENATLLNRINTIADEIRKRSNLEHEYHIQKAKLIQSTKIIEDFENQNAKLKEEIEEQKKLFKQLQEKHIRTKDLLQFQNSLIRSSVVHVQDDNPVSDELQMLNLDVESTEEERAVLKSFNKYMCTLDLQNGSVLDLILCQSDKDGFVDIVIRSFYKIVDDKREDLDQTKLPFPLTQKSVSVEETEISTFIGAILSWAARTNPL